MKLKSSRTLVAAILLGVAFSASAQETVPDIHVSSADACPADTFLSGTSYTWQDGHLVRDGYVCESLFQGSD